MRPRDADEGKGDESKRPRFKSPVHALPEANPTKYAELNELQLRVAHQRAVAGREEREMSGVSSWRASRRSATDFAT